MMYARWAGALTTLVVAGTALGCGSGPEPTTARPAASGFPSLESYDSACHRDADCTLVPGEGCGSCTKAALSTKAAASYSAAYAQASQAPTCKTLLQTAGACTGVVVTARCVASVCGVQVGEVR